MRCILLYAPPWRIPAPGERIDRTDPFRPSDNMDERMEAKSGGDLSTIPYGLLSLAANGRRAGHQVEVINLFTFPWREVVFLVSHLQADLIGLNCMSHNRRGVAALARLIRQTHPSLPLIAGGAFITALPHTTLEQIPELDLAILGEGEEAFLAILERLQAQQPITGLPGTVWREAGGLVAAPAAPRIADLDQLASVQDYFSPRIVLTARGCPGDCSFCSSTTLWGRKLKVLSVSRTLEVIRQAVKLHGRRFLMIKDETFTANRRRAMELCRGIREEGLNFIWSCDTRVDHLDEELLRAMRMAGCQRISLGVESGSVRVLERMGKKVRPEQVIQTTHQARRFGFQVRFFLITENPGETRQDLEETVLFLQQARPTELLHGGLLYFPGTREFQALQQAHGIENEIFFKRPFLFPTRENLLHEGVVSPELREHRRWIADRLAPCAYPYTLEEYREALTRLPGCAAAHMDLAGACIQAGLYQEAEQHLQAAMEADYPLPGFALNYQACIAAAAGDFVQARALLEQALAVFPHHVVQVNLSRLNAWLKNKGSNAPLNLLANNAFETIADADQPEKPGPLTIAGTTLPRLHSHRSERNDLQGP